VHVALEVDVTSESSVADAFSSLTGSVFGMVYCVGGTRTPMMPQPRLIDSSLEDWCFAEAINARGAFLAVREFLRHRKTKPASSGRIVTIASVAGQVAGRNAGVAYSAAKAALLSITRTAAAEAAELQITANAISPGPTDSTAFAVGSGRDAKSRAAVLSRIPLRRLGSPEEIAAAVQFLLSEQAGFITGATIDVNGGLLMRS
jgi:3-oxoacyl-[acyl-carrier protein] reductase